MTFLHFDVISEAVMRRNFCRIETITLIPLTTHMATNIEEINGKLAEVLETIVSQMNDGKNQLASSTLQRVLDVSRKNSMRVVGMGSQLGIHIILAIKPAGGKYLKWSEVPLKDQALLLAELQMYSPIIKEALGLPDDWGISIMKADQNSARREDFHIHLTFSPSRPELEEMGLQLNPFVDPRIGPLDKE